MIVHDLPWTCSLLMTIPVWSPPAMCIFSLVCWTALLSTIRVVELAVLHFGVMTIFSSISDILNYFFNHSTNFSLQNKIAQFGNDKNLRKFNEVGVEVSCCQLIYFRAWHDLVQYSKYFRQIIIHGQKLIPFL